MKNRYTFALVILLTINALQPLYAQQKGQTTHKKKTSAEQTIITDTLSAKLISADPLEIPVMDNNTRPQTLTDTLIIMNDDLIQKRAVEVMIAPRPINDSAVRIDINDTGKFDIGVSYPIDSLSSASANRHSIDIPKNSNDSLQSSADSNAMVFPNMYLSLAQFPEGEGDLLDFRRWVMSRIIYPVAALEQGIAGQVVASFTVNNQGFVEDVKIVKSVDPQLDNEVVRVIKNSPQWIPAINAATGQPVSMQYIIPVRFVIQN